MAQRQRSGTSGQVYLGHDLDTCGWKILSQEFFTETHYWEYYEPLASCSRRTRKRIQEPEVLCNRLITHRISPYNVCGCHDFHQNH
ncbi:junction-mediating and -regulatory protein-like isoform X4 [Camelus bactrianus]|uniref:Junction-mediating and -regulatory protein-like isoform X3 n=2 Tax=Camelus bactrianus TaxID=9837 RepID=A0AC58NIS9_CAMBA